MPIELDDRGRALENEYFRRQERELIEKMKAKIASEPTVDTGLECPRCDGKLLETDYENIKIDICAKCGGAWLDAWELAQIVVKEEQSGGWFKNIFGS